MARRVPERLVWAVERLDVGADTDVLEIGCGRGVAAALVCGRLTTGTFTGVDRSAVAVAAAENANAEHVASGRARFQLASVTDADLGGAAFDTVFAAHVNLFWTRPPAPELDVLRGALRPGGALHLFYEPMSADQVTSVTEKITANVTDHGFTVTAQDGEAGGRAQLQLTLTPR